MFGFGITTTVGIPRRAGIAPVRGGVETVPRLPAGAAGAGPGTGAPLAQSALGPEAARALALLQVIDAGGSNPGPARLVAAPDRETAAQGRLPGRVGGVQAGVPFPAHGTDGRRAAIGSEPQASAAPQPDGAETIGVRTVPGRADPLALAEPPPPGRPVAAQAGAPWLATPAGLALVGTAFPATPATGLRAGTGASAPGRLPHLRWALTLAVLTLLAAAALWPG